MVNHIQLLWARKARMNLPLDDKIFYGITLLLVSILFFTVLYPLLFILAASFSSANAVYAGKVFVWPVEFGIHGYKLVFNNPEVWMGYANTIKYTLLGTLIDVFMIMITAYPMARKELPGRNIFMTFFAFTLFFNGGMIPNYLVVRSLGLIDTIGALVLPGALSVYYMIVARTFIQSNIPNELLQAAQIDGCNDTSFFFRVVIPLSKAIIAVTILFQAVSHWNAFFNAMIYLNTRSKVPLQLVLRDILVASNYAASTKDLSAMDPEMIDAIQRTADIMKYALIVFSSAPIMLFYPIAQKYFIKGVMIGSLKG